MFKFIVNNLFSEKIMFWTARLSQNETGLHSYSRKILFSSLAFFELKLTIDLCDWWLEADQL